jgi:hypothetical protein
VPDVRPRLGIVLARKNFQKKSQSQNSEPSPTTYIQKKRKILQWDNTTPHITEYNPLSTPNQTLSFYSIKHPKIIQTIHASLPTSTKEYNPKPIYQQKYQPTKNSRKKSQRRKKRIISKSTKLLNENNNI